MQLMQLVQLLPALLLLWLCSWPVRIHRGCAQLWWNCARASSRTHLCAKEAVVPMAVAGVVLETAQAYGWAEVQEA